MLAVQFRKILIPRTVRREISRKHRTRNKLKNLITKLQGFLEYCNAADQARIELLCDARQNPDGPIQQGEAETIVQATEQEFTDVLMDDKDGRDQAIKHGLTPIGVLGILVNLQTLELISDGPVMIKKLKKDLGYRIDPKILTSVEWP